ncbi:MAG: hypothetical protein VW397_07900, partial [Candidatus Margulisiibacteriota bacterium]
ECVTVCNGLCVAPPLKGVESTALGGGIAGLGGSSTDPAAGTTTQNALVMPSSVFKLDALFANVDPAASKVTASPVDKNHVQITLSEGLNLSHKETVQLKTFAEKYNISQIQLSSVNDNTYEFTIDGTKVNLPVPDSYDNLAELIGAAYTKAKFDNALKAFLKNGDFGELSDFLPLGRYTELKDFDSNDLSKEAIVEICQQNNINFKNVDNLNNPGFKHDIAANLNALQASIKIRNVQIERLLADVKRPRMKNKLREACQKIDISGKNEKEIKNAIKEEVAKIFKDKKLKKIKIKDINIKLKDELVLPKTEESKEESALRKKKKADFIASITNEKLNDKLREAWQDFINTGEIDYISCLNPKLQIADGKIVFANVEESSNPLNSDAAQAVTKDFMTPEEILTGLNNMLQNGGEFQAYLAPPKSVFSMGLNSTPPKDVLTTALTKVRNNVARYHDELNELDIPEEYKKKLKEKKIGLSNYEQRSTVKSPSEFTDGVLSEGHRLFIGGTPSNDIKAEIDDFFIAGENLNEKLVNQMKKTIRLYNQGSSDSPLVDLDFLLKFNQELRLTDEQINDMILLISPKEETPEGYVKRHNQAMKVLVENFEHWPEVLSDSTIQNLIEMANLANKLKKRSKNLIQFNIQISSQKENILNLLEKYKPNSRDKVNETYKILLPIFFNDLFRKDDLIPINRLLESLEVNTRFHKKVKVGEELFDFHNENEWLNSRTAEETTGIKSKHVLTVTETDNDGNTVERIVSVEGNNEVVLMSIDDEKARETALKAPPEVPKSPEEIQSEKEMVANFDAAFNKSHEATTELLKNSTVKECMKMAGSKNVKEYVKKLFNNAPPEKEAEIFINLASVGTNTIGNAKQIHDETTEQTLTDYQKMGKKKLSALLSETDPHDIFFAAFSTGDVGLTLWGADGSNLPENKFVKNRNEEIERENDAPKFSLPENDFIEGLVENSLPTSTELKKRNKERPKGLSSN